MLISVPPCPPYSQRHNAYLKIFEALFTVIRISFISQECEHIHAFVHTDRHVVHRKLIDLADIELQLVIIDCTMRRSSPSALPWENGLQVKRVMRQFFFFFFFASLSALITISSHTCSIENLLHLPLPLNSQQ